MNPMPELAPMLKQLRLSGILESLPNRNQEAIESKLSYSEFLALLIQDEVARRENKKFTLRVRRAGAVAVAVVGGVADTGGEAALGAGGLVLAGGRAAVAGFGVAVVALFPGIGDAISTDCTLGRLG